jgi:hypothetical protein
MSGLTPEPNHDGSSRTQQGTQRPPERVPYSVPCSDCEVPLRRGLPDGRDDYPG